LRDGDAETRKKEIGKDSGRQRRRKNAVYAEWKKNIWNT